MMMKLTTEDRTLLLNAIEFNKDGKFDVVCNACRQPIVIERDNTGRALKSSCECGKFNSTFRPI
jgi:hypothetical protein